MRFFANLLFVGVLGLSVSAAWADALPEGPAGGVVFDNSFGFDIDRETLEVAKEKISVDYDLAASAESRSQSMQFSLPDYSGSGPWPAPAGQPLRLHLTVDGRPVSFKTRVTAFHNEKDVTRFLHQLGMTDRQIALFPGDSPFKEVSVTPLSARQRHALLRAGLLEKSDACGDTCLEWTTRITYFWTAFVPAAHVTHVHVDYAPFSSEKGDTDRVNRDELTNVYCATSSDLHDWDEASKSSGEQKWLPTSNLTYILANADENNFDSIRDFILRIKKEDPNELANYCFPGERKKVSATVEETHLHNYFPAGKLSVRFGNLKHPREVPDDDYEAPVLQR